MCVNLRPVAVCVDPQGVDAARIRSRSDTRSVNVGDDCPVFDGLFEYCSISAGGSMGPFDQARPL